MGGYAGLSPAYPPIYSAPTPSRMRLPIRCVRRTPRLLPAPPLRSRAEDAHGGAGSKRGVLRTQRIGRRIRLGVGAEYMGGYAGLGPAYRPYRLCPSVSYERGKREDPLPPLPPTPQARRAHRGRGMRTLCSSRRLRLASESLLGMKPSALERRQKSVFSASSSRSEAAKRRTRPPSSAAIARPSRKSTRLGAIAATRASGVTMPTRLRGSAPESATSAPLLSSSLTARSGPTASASANCSPRKPETKRPPRISPRASSRRYTDASSRQVGRRDSRASNARKTTP